MIPALLDTDVSAPVRLTSGKVRCNLCCLQEFCEPDSLTRHEIDFLKTFVKKQELRLRRGEQLYRQGDEFRALFAVHTGSFKVCVAADDGKERVTGFSLAGDMMGLDAIDAGRHGDYAVALEDGGVCLLPWERLEEAAARMPLVRRQVMRMLSREVRREQELGTMRGHFSAERRFAAFLLSLSRQFASRGFDGERFRLTMSRPDIGNFLGLTAETVSRLFTRFRDAELIQVRARDVELLRTDALRALIRSKN
ncbi:MAG: helix-turn-helix domain-containing protein [Betaproteobacteria bacterium]|nr:helix-turn-helix domain-containing protein [Betaproteobacteria bacterium]